jgi:hypothetical protein
MNAILGVLFASLVGLLVFPQYARQIADSNQNTRMVATAQQEKRVYEAAAKYVEQNSTALQAIATPANLAIVTIPMLQSVQLLDPSFSAVNPYQQTWQVQVLQPSPGYLQMFVTAVGGEALDDRQSAKIASLVGASGGFVPLNDSGSFAGGASQARGSFGGWQVSTANYAVTGGRPAALLTYAAGQIQNNHLYRNAVPGQPQLNQMNTELGMTGNSISGVNQFIGKQGMLSVDGAGAYGGTATLNLSENTLVTGKKPAIQFHSSGRQEGYIELSGDPGEVRRFNLKDNQGVGVGLSATGQITAPSVALPAGDTLSIGPSRFYGDGYNTAIRSVDTTFIEHLDGGPGRLVADNTYTYSDTVSNRDVNVSRNANVNGVSNLYGGINTAGAVAISQAGWGLFARDGNGQDNASQQNPAGSLYVNDIFVRSVGKWASQLVPAASGASSLGGNGSNGYKILDPATGLSMQWGSSTARGQNQTQCYNYAFAHAVLFVTVQTVGRSTLSGDGHDYVGTRDQNCFTFDAEPSSGGITWFAVGW